MASRTETASLEVQNLIEPYVVRIGGLIHALRAIMQRYGWIDPESLPIIASVFNKSIAEVRGVVSFYVDFKTEPPRTNLIRICQAESCQSLGSRKLMRAYDDSSLGASEAVEFEPVYCLGICPLGPAAEVNGTLVANATIEKIQEHRE